MGEPLAISLGALCELADDRACLVPQVWEPDLGLLLKGDDGLGDLEFGQEASLYHIGEQDRRHPLLLLEVGAEPGPHNWVEALGELPSSDLCEAGADVVWHWAVNGDAGHAEAGVAEALEPGCSLSFPMKLSG